MKLSHFVIDSSVVGKWYLPDEHGTNAIRIKDDFAVGAITLSVPLLLFYEVNNILRNAVIQVRIDQREAVKAYQNLYELNFVTHFSEDLLKDALDKALRLGITSYDASYVVLAESLRVPLYTADKKLVEKVKSELVRNVESYLISSG